MNLILFEPAELATDQTAQDHQPTPDARSVRLTGARAEHIRRVLKAATGQSLRIGVIDGPSGTAVVSDICDDHVMLQVALEAEVPPRPAIDLLLALPRPKVMRRLWAQLAAIGVDRIILTNAEKVERDYFDTHYLAESIYRPLLIEGLQQAKDTRLPRVSIHKRFKVLVEDELDALAGDARRLVAHPVARADARAPSGVGSHAAPRGPLEPSARRHDGRVMLAIGPEGGWNDFELALLDAHGFERVTMGPRTLRTDTACIAMLSIVHRWWIGDCAVPRPG